MAVLGLWLPLTVFLMLMTFPLRAENSAQLPPALQAALLAKIFQLDKTIQTKGMDNAVLVLVETPSSKKIIKEVAKAVRPLRITTKIVSASELNKVKKASAVYIPSDAPLDVVSAFCKTKGALSISMKPAHAVSGKVAIAIGLRSDKRPEIVVNLPRAKSEGHVLSSALLKLARVIE